MMMVRFRCAATASIVSFALSMNIILAFSLFNIPSPRSSSRDIIRLRNKIGNNSEDHNEIGRGSKCGYSILLADNREKVLNIKLYRFGGPSLEEYMKSNPDLSRQDALRSLTSSFDDKGIQKVLYGNGGTGESVQFCALANDVSSFVSSMGYDCERTKASLLKTHGVIGSIEAVEEFWTESDCTNVVSIELKNLSLHVNARRLGIGRALTEAVQEYARNQVSIRKQQGNQTCTAIVHLIVESNNEGAMKLYKETGFVPENPEIKDQLCRLTWSTDGEVH